MYFGQSRLNISIIKDKSIKKSNIENLHIVKNIFAFMTVR